MNVLILKLNATGDVVRTTCLLRRFPGAVTWITAASNRVLIEGLQAGLRCLAWEHRTLALDVEYDLVLNLEDEREVAAFAKAVRCKQLFGAYLDRAECLRYTDDARSWFDMSLISVHGKRKADELKLLNRRSYQHLIFEGLGLRFDDDRYVLPRATKSALVGDVAIAAASGPVWPMKAWAHYDDLQLAMERLGLRVNVLPHRSSLLEHLGDIANHRCLVGGDSLPMHLALGSGVPCVTVFNCTSPWEIHGYGIQTKVISPRLGEFFYQRGFDERAIRAVGLDQVLNAVLDTLSRRSQLQTLES
jgi:ADP-heptose:LPS heptosyltransferase